MMSTRIVAIGALAVLFCVSWLRHTLHHHARRALSAIALSILVAGCAGMRYGNFIPDSPINQQPIIQDAAVQLVRLYPPAQNTFALQQQTPDKFGRELVDELRARGYAVAEIGKFGQSPSTDTPGALALRYVLDRPDANLYRLTLLIGSQTLSRPYREQFKDLVPAGDWIRRE
jgi:hypothetical protein